MTPTDSFPATSPEMARDRFLVKNESWSKRFKDNFNRFIVAPLEYSWPVIKLPLAPSRTSNHALFLVTAGQVELTVGHQAFTVKEQELIIVPALQIFTLHTIREDRLLLNGLATELCSRLGISLASNQWFIRFF